MSTPTPTPGALSAAREIHSENWSVMTYDQMVISGALIIDRHTARPDVDALVKALEEIARIGETELVHVHPAHGSAPHQVARIARSALARRVSHAKAFAKRLEKLKADALARSSAPFHHRRDDPHSE